MKSASPRLPAIILCFAVAACGEPEMPLPVIEPQVEQGAPDAIYGVQAGPFPLLIFATLSSGFNRR